MTGVFSKIIIYNATTSANTRQEARLLQLVRVKGGHVNTPGL